MAGDRLIEFLERARQEAGQAGTWLSAASCGPAGGWSLAGRTWTAQVIVDPERWIGLVFKVHDPRTGCVLDYCLDTDLYNPGQPGSAFGGEIETEILSFLGSLRQGNILRSTRTAKLILLVPDGDGYIKLVAGRHVSSKSRAQRSAAVSGFAAVE